MKTWNQAPLVRLLLPFLAGIIAAAYLPIQFEYGILFIVAMVIIISFIVLVPKLNVSYRRSSWFGALVNIILFFSAYQLTILKTEKFSKNHFSKFISKESFVYAKLTEPYLEKERTLKVVMEIMAVKQNREWKSTYGKAMIYLKKDAHALKLNYGDELILKAEFKDVPPPQNPGEFDYKSFLAHHNIFQQSYIKAGDWVYNGTNSGNIIQQFCISLRNKLLNVLTENHLQGDEFAVGAALLLGYTDKLDPEIISSYASTGALHVLSVSGLHVAIVYIVFDWLLFFFKKIKYGAIIKAILLILFLWFYAALTGLSPSVLRAAAMFSFVIIARSFNRYTNIYNTLAASAFLLLIINPYLIMDVGFQLSYLAVIGIVYMQPKIYNRLEVNNWLLDQAWMITSVSIAAQIVTFPMGLYYFHQFPDYFLLSNFIVIPVSTAIIYLGIALFAFAKISIAAVYLALGFKWSIWFLNASVQTIEKWPYALIQGISISIPDTLLIYGMIILLIYYLTKPKPIYIVLVLCAMIILLCFQISEQHNQYQQKKLIVYNIPKTSAIDFISAKNNVLLTDSLFAKNRSGILFHIAHNWWDLGINNTKIISDTIQTENLCIANDFIQFYNKRVILINDKIDFKKLHSRTPLEIDYLIVSKNLRMHITNILKIYHPKEIIFDSSNSEYNINKWKKECSSINQTCYSVEEKGALVIDLTLRSP